LILVAVGTALFLLLSRGSSAKGNPGEADAVRPATGAAATRPPRNLRSVPTEPGPVTLESQRAEEVETRIQTRYQELFKGLPEGQMYLDLLDRAGTPADCRWRAFLTLHTFCLLFDESEFEIRSLKARSLEILNLSDQPPIEPGIEPDPRAISTEKDPAAAVKALNAHADSVQINFDFLRRQAATDLRRFNPNLSDADLSVLFRFRPERLPLALPRVERDEVYLGY